VSGKIEARLKQIGLVVPPAPAAAANYVPWTRSGNLVFIAGQGPVVDGKVLFVGKVGREFDVASGQQAARLVAVNLLAQAKAACEGDLDRIVRWVRLGAFVNCIDDFTQQPEVVNGASDLLVEIFGDAGRHARFAVGVNALPRGFAVEIDATLEIRA
jgi:enamine deaminase RidA (YjgF/YER057c/UK114 family)